MSTRGHPPSCHHRSSDPVEDTLRSGERPPLPNSFPLRAVPESGDIHPELPCSGKMEDACKSFSDWRSPSQRVAKPEPPVSKSHLHRPPPYSCLGCGRQPGLFHAYCFFSSIPMASHRTSSYGTCPSRGIKHLGFLGCPPLSHHAPPPSGSRSCIKLLSHQPDILQD